MVSIIVPVYNSEKVIGRCIESILSQTYSDIELILINDGSEDSSGQICKGYGIKDCRVRVISQMNTGVSATRNRGLDIAKGEYVQFVDSDDYIALNMVEKLVIEAKAEDSDLVICGCTEIHSDHNYTLLPEIQGTIKTTQLSKEYPDIFAHFLLNSPCNKLYRKDKILKKFKTDMSLGEDLLFNLEYIRQIESISFLKDNLYFYVIYQNSLNRKYRPDSIEIAEKLYIESIRFSQEYSFDEKAVKDISSVFVRFSLYGLFDVYDASAYNLKRKREILHKYLKNNNVKTAVRYAEMNGLQQKVARILVKYKMAMLLEIFFRLKGKINK